MNGEIIPAVVAATAGSGLVAGIAAYETRRDAAMRAGRESFGLRFPVGASVPAAEAAVRVLSGLDERLEVVTELVATDGLVRFGLRVPKGSEERITGAFASALPGLRVTDEIKAVGRATLAVKLHLPTPLVLHDGDAEAGAASLRSAVSGLHPGETVIVRWALMPGRPRRWDSRPAKADADERAERQAWQRKRGQTGLRAAGLVLVQAGSKVRAREIAGGVVAALRAREVRVGAIRTTSDASGRSLSALPRVTRFSGFLTLAELLPVLGWPTGSEVTPGVELGGSRELQAGRGVAANGRVLFAGRDARGTRPVGISPQAALRHMAVVGSTGSGKSALIGRAVLQDFHAGFGGLVIDPKADLVASLLDRVTPSEADRVVVIDPSDNRPVPGIDVFRSGDPDLRADVILGALAAIFTSSFGIRSELYGRLALRTLAEVPGATLADFGRLFSDAGFRGRALTHLSDPLLVSQWQAFEALSAPAQVEHVQSPLAKITALLARPSVRSVLASHNPTLDLAEAFEAGRWVLVSLSPGTLGEPAARLLGAVLLYQAWTAIEGRAVLPPEKRTPVFFYLDELSTLASLPIGLELLLERARGLGAGVTVALQSLARLPEPLRAALLGNVQTLISFRASADEAARIARELPGLDARDLQALGRYEVAARVPSESDRAAAVVTGETLDWPTTLGAGARVRDLSAELYGSADAAPAALREPVSPDGQFGRARRAS